MKNTFGHIARYAGSNRWFIAFIIFLAVFRFSLATSGHMHWADEIRYYPSIAAWQNITHGNLEEALTSLFKAQGRPGGVLFGIIPAALQVTLYGKDVSIFGNPRFFVAPNAFNPHVFDIPSFCNALSTLVISILFYHILLFSIKTRRLALLGTVVYSLLCNTNTYIRHLLPYDTSLMLFMAGFFIVIRAHASGKLRYKTALGCGILCGLAFATYPGYYLFAIVIFILIYSLSRNYLILAMYYVISFAAILGIFELASGMCGMSYIKNSFLLASTITHGSFEEGLIYVFRYMAEVEGLIGYCLLSLFLFCAVWLLPRKKILLRPVFVVVILGYIIYGIQAVFLRKAVFYGRLIHMYIPFVVMGAMLSLHNIRGERKQKLAMIAVAGISMLSFISFAWRYTRISYPKNLIYRALPDIPGRNIYMADELTATKPPFIPGQHKVVLVNVIDFAPIPEKIYPVKIPEGMRLVNKTPHPINFPAHQFEGFSIPGRKRMRERNYQMSIYKE